MGSFARIGWGNGRLWKERAILNEDLRHIFAEKLLLKGRMPQFAGCGDPSAVGERTFLLLSRTDDIW